MSEEKKTTDEGRIEIEDGSEEKETKQPEDNSENTADASVEKKENGDSSADSVSGTEKSGEKRGNADEEALSHSEKKALKKKDEEIADLTDRYKRTLAEYENFRKRTEKEKADLYSFAVRDVMTKVLPVLDNLERGLQTLSDDQKSDPVAQGMDKIEKQFEKTLEDLGIKEIEAQGKPFDPAYHNAVMHVDDDSVPENTVVEVFQKGYTYRDTVVRHAMVKVAN